MDVTVGNNSYISVADADTYFGGRLYSDSWLDATDTQKAQALIMSTKVIDRQLFKGKRKETDQALQFPRCYSAYPSTNETIGNFPELADMNGWTCETEVTQNVLDACCEEAIALLERGNSQRRKLQVEGIASFSLGNLSETYRPGAGRGLMSQEARELLRSYLAGSVNIV